MADAYTQVSDIIEPKVFEQYVIERIADKSVLIRSGISVRDPHLDELASDAGNSYTMPVWGQLTGASQLWTDGAPIEVKKIESKSDHGVKLFRANAWGSSDLSAAMAGDDPQRAIAELVADYWVKEEQRILIESLKGVFASSGMSTHLEDDHKSPITSAMVLDAKQKLGDAADQLRALVMHSAVYTYLQKQGLITEISQISPVTGEEVTFTKFLGYDILQDDTVPFEDVYELTTDTEVDATKTYYTRSGSGTSQSPYVYTAVESPVKANLGTYYEKFGVYTTYLCAYGVIGRGEGRPLRMVPVETSRDAKYSRDALFHRRALILKPYGIKFNASTMTAESPSDAELALGTNWTKVYDDKNIGLVAIKHTI